MSTPNLTTSDFRVGSRPIQLRKTTGVVMDSRVRSDTYVYGGGSSSGGTGSVSVNSTVVVTSDLWVDVPGTGERHFRFRQETVGFHPGSRIQLVEVVLGDQAEVICVRNADTGEQGVVALSASFRQRLRMPYAPNTIETIIICMGMGMLGFMVGLLVDFELPPFSSLSRLLKSWVASISDATGHWFSSDSVMLTSIQLAVGLASLALLVRLFQRLRSIPAGARFRRLIEAAQRALTED